MACNRVGDEYCDVGTDPTNANDQCPYGPPGGPGVHSDSACPDIVVKKAPGCATWAGASGIWNTTLRDSCSTLGGCHDAGKAAKDPTIKTGAADIYLPYDDAEKAFDRLKTYKPVNYPYVSDTEPQHTWILCNLQRTMDGKAVPGGGTNPMPSGAPLSADKLKAVQDWASCGEEVGTNGGGGAPDGGADTDAGADAGP